MEIKISDLQYELNNADGPVVRVESWICLFWNRANTAAL